MALLYKTYKNNNSHSKGYGKWYMAPVITDTVGIEQIASKMQENCTVKRADILAVLSELGPVMKELMHQSLRVEIPYLGHFKLSLSSTGETEKAKVIPTQNLKKTRVIFQPKYTIDRVNGRRTELLEGITLKSVEDLATPGWRDAATSGTSGDASGDGETGRP